MKKVYILDALKKVQETIEQHVSNAPPEYQKEAQELSNEVIPLIKECIKKAESGNPFSKEVFESLLLEISKLGIKELAEYFQDFIN